MRISLNIASREFEVDLDIGTSLAIPQRFDQNQPNLFGVPAASAHVVEQANFVGSTRRGGGCNVMRWSIVPHCHGTHTESISHIVNENVPLSVCLGAGFVVAVVMTVTPIAMADAGSETYFHALPEDRVITRQQVQAVVSSLAACGGEAMVVRTVPNGSAKRSTHYDHEPIPPYFTVEAMGAIAESGVKHLLVDLPSIDRILDEGRLANHHVFWNVSLGSKQRTSQARIERTITEFIYVPDEIADGLYLLNLQAPDVGIDAAPSRPLIWPLRENTLS